MMLYHIMWCQLLVSKSIFCSSSLMDKNISAWVAQRCRGAYRNIEIKEVHRYLLRICLIFRYFRYSVFWSYGQLWHIFLHVYHVSWIQIPHIHLMFPSFGPCAQPQGMIGVLAYSVFSEAGSQRGAGFCWFCFHSAPGPLQAPHVALQQLGHLTSQLATGHWGTIGYP